MPESISLFKNAKNEEKYMAAYDKALKLWPIPYETTFIPTKIGSTHVIVSGNREGKPLVMLHGAAASATMWYANVEELGKNHRIFAVDTVTDIGKSKIFSLPKTRQDLADWLVEVLNGLEIEKPHLVGLSYGGFITMSVAYYNPDLVDKIVMLAPAAVFEKLSMTFWIQAFSAMLLPFKSRIEGFLKWMTAEGNEQLNAYRDQFILAMGLGRSKLSIMPSVFSDDELKSIEKLALLLVGDHEVIYNGPRVIERAKQLMPNVQTELVPNCGHGVAMEQPEFVNSRILQFLGEG
jgi:pimeloyl-ACP methyl ester carboxylesterase